MIELMDGRRFEGLVGMPVDRYDRQWRERILALRPPAAVVRPAR